jgi:alpha-mannosidase
LSEGVIRAEMLRGTRFVSVKVVRGDEVTSMNYPPPGTYVFHYSLSSAKGDWKASKAYRAGMNWNNPLLPIEVMDEISKKTLPPTQSFCSVKQDSLVISALKKADLSSSILLRVYDMEGSPVETSVEFLGSKPAFGEVNLLEEETGSKQEQTLRAGPYAIRTIKLNLNSP